MNKSELIAAVAHQSGVSKTDVAKVLNSIIYQISENVSQDEEVKLVGFGNFVLQRRNARTGLNPRTGEKVEIPAKKVMVFRASKALNKIIDDVTS